MNKHPHVTTDVEYVAHVLNDGGLAGIPTETVYGLGARADLRDSVYRIFDVKGRPRNHPLIAHIGENADPSKWAQFNDAAQLLVEHFWPGPLTLLLPKTDHVGPWVTGGRETVGLRMPRHAMTLKLLSLVEDAVVAPSANRFGKVSPTTAEHVAHDLGSDVDCILDGGRCELGLESTIVECVAHTVTVLRPGAVTAADISKVLGGTVSFEQGESRAPGMMLSHYAPDAQVQLAHSLDEALSIQQEVADESKTSRVLWFEETAEYALHLYDFLRQCDFENIQVVIAVLPHGDGIATAIRDRLYKAAAES